MDSFP